MRPVLIPLALVALTACQVDPSANEERPNMQETCIAPSLQDYVGRPVSSLDAISLPSPARVIGPDMGVTMDYRPERLNVEYDRKRIIQRIFCG